MSSPGEKLVRWQAFVWRDFSVLSVAVSNQWICGYERDTDELTICLRRTDNLSVHLLETSYGERY